MVGTNSYSICCICCMLCVRTTTYGIAKTLTQKTREGIAMMFDILIDVALGGDESEE